MDFRIADTFTDSLARLTGDEQKAVKTTAFDLQLNPANPGHELPQARQGEGQELLVGAGQQRHPADRAQERRQPAALLRRSPRQGLRLGRAAQAGDASEDRRGAVGRDPRDGAGGRTSRSTCRPSCRAADASREAAVRRTSATTNCWATACRPSGWTTCGQATEDTLLALADHLPAEAAEALAGTGDRRQAAGCRATVPATTTRSIIPTRSAASA